MCLKVAAEEFSELLMCGICEAWDVSGQSLLDSGSQNKPVDTACEGGTDTEMWLLFCACFWGKALVINFFLCSLSLCPSLLYRMVQSTSVSGNPPCCLPSALHILHVLQTLPCEHTPALGGWKQ